MAAFRSYYTEMPLIIQQNWKLWIFGIRWNTVFSLEKRKELIQGCRKDFGKMSILNTHCERPMEFTIKEFPFKTFHLFWIMERKTKHPMGVEKSGRGKKTALEEMRLGFFLGPWWTSSPVPLRTILNIHHDPTFSPNLLRSSLAYNQELLFQGTWGQPALPSASTHTPTDSPTSSSVPFAFPHASSVEDCVVLPEDEPSPCASNTFPNSFQVSF